MPVRIKHSSSSIFKGRSNLSRKLRTANNRFRKCYAAAVFADDAGLRRLVDRLTRDDVVLIDDIVAHSKKEFFDKYRPTERTKKALILSLKQMGLQFAD